MSTPAPLVYLEAVPPPDLRPWIRQLWYCRAPSIAHPRERVLPNGCIQLILNLLQRPLTGGTGNDDTFALPDTIVVGARQSFEIIHTVDLKELLGVVVEPGCFASFFQQRADLFFEQSIALDNFWPRLDVDRLRALPNPQTKLNCLVQLLRGKRRTSKQQFPRPLVAYALERLRMSSASVETCARDTGLSQRRFSSIFREEVGLTPKLWHRICRFGAACRRLHAGADENWSQLALDCGYYDQSHFANEFRLFSGINPSTYSANKGRWQNHVPVW